jgi:hypothetical protein
MAYTTLWDLLEAYPIGVKSSQNFPGWMELSPHLDLEFAGDQYKPHGTYRLVAFTRGNQPHLNIIYENIEGHSIRGASQLSNTVFQGFTTDAMWAMVGGAQMKGTMVQAAQAPPTMPPPAKFPTTGRACTCGASSIGAPYHSQWCDIL